MGDYSWPVCTPVSCTVYVACFHLGSKIGWMKNLLKLKTNLPNLQLHVHRKFHWLQQHGLKIFLKISKCFLVSHALYTHRTHTCLNTCKVRTAFGWESELNPLLKFCHLKKYLTLHWDNSFSKKRKKRKQSSRRVLPEDMCSPTCHS